MMGTCEPVEGNSDSNTRPLTLKVFTFCLDALFATALCSSHFANRGSSKGISLVVYRTPATYGYRSCCVLYQIRRGTSGVLESASSGRTLDYNSS